MQYHQILTPLCTSAVCSSVQLLIFILSLIFFPAKKPTNHSRLPVAHTEQRTIPQFLSCLLFCGSRIFGSDLLRTHATNTEITHKIICEWFSRGGKKLYVSFCSQVVSTVDRSAGWSFTTSRVSPCWLTPRRWEAARRARREKLPMLPNPRSSCPTPTKN